MSSIAISYKWLLNPVDDIVLFVLLPIVGFLIANIVEIDPVNLLWVSTAFMILIDYSHLPLTFSSHKTRWKHSVFKPQLTVLLFLTIYIFSVYFWNQFKDLFFYIVAFLVTQHQVRQLYGWLLISQNKNQKNNISIFDKIFFYNITLLPYLLSFSDISIHKNPKIFMDGDMKYLSMNSLTANVVYKIWVFIILFYLIYETTQILKTRVFLFNKYLIYLCAFFVFSYCYLWVPLALYWLPHTMHHGYSYIRYNLEQNLKHTASIPQIKLTLSYILFIAVIGAGYYTMGHIVKIHNPLLASIYWPFIWSIAIFHYISDAFIWRKKWRPH